MLLIMLVIFDFFFNFNTKVLKILRPGYNRYTIINLLRWKSMSLLLTLSDKNQQEDQYSQLLQEQHCLQLLLMLGCMLLITTKLNKQQTTTTEYLHAKQLLYSWSNYCYYNCCNNYMYSYWSYIYYYCKKHNKFPSPCTSSGCQMVLEKRTGMYSMK